VREPPPARPGKDPRELVIGRQGDDLDHVAVGQVQPVGGVPMSRRQGAGEVLRPAPGAWNPQDNLGEPILTVGVLHGGLIVTPIGGPDPKPAKTQDAARKPQGEARPRPGQ
jgi:hypothetical protein